MGIKLYQAAMHIPASSGEYSASYAAPKRSKRGKRNKAPKRPIPRGFFVSAFLEVDENGFFDLKIMSSITLVILDIEDVKFHSEKVSKHFREKYEEYLPMQSPMSAFEVEESVRLYHTELDDIVFDLVQQSIKKGKIKIAPMVPPSDNFPEYTNDGVVVIPATNGLYTGRQKAVLN